MRATSTLTSAFLSIVLIGSAGVRAQGQDTPGREAPSVESKGMPPRVAPGEYQAQAQAGAVTVAAEFMGHSVPTPEGTYTTEDFVVVEAALFGPPQALRAQLSIGDFSL